MKLQMSSVRSGCRLSWNREDPAAAFDRALANKQTVFTQQEYKALRVLTDPYQDIARLSSIKEQFNVIGPVFRTNYYQTRHDAVMGAEPTLFRVSKWQGNLIQYYAAHYFPGGSRFEDIESDYFAKIIGFLDARLSRQFPARPRPRLVP